MKKSNGYPQAQPRGTKAYLKQYVEGLSGEHARHTKLRLSRRVRSHRGGEVRCLRLLILALSQRRIGAPVAPLLQWAKAAEAFMNNAG
ncbi:hypothetical protein DNFV4_01722 [Nitrospira tepida]|uniref:Uncharacterized protein n=1 Tax=Nitrospira tepida TaxID=2973512 RepID=A0AA86TBA0_9BACT|nr:hypothetical protein DNFV4_01722 [Nitrospira tepida]